MKTKLLWVALAILAGWLLSYVVVPAHAIVPPVGNLGTITNANTSSACTCAGNSCTGTGCLSVDMADDLYVEFVITGTCTCQINQRLTGGTNFLLGPNAAVTANAIQRIQDPAGIYDFQTTSCAVGSCTVNYQYVKK